MLTECEFMMNCIIFGCSLWILWGAADGQFNHFFFISFFCLLFISIWLIHSSLDSVFLWLYFHFIAVRVFAYANAIQTNRTVGFFVQTPQTISKYMMICWMNKNDLSALVYVENVTHTNRDRLRMHQFSSIMER